MGDAPSDARGFSLSLCLSVSLSLIGLILIAGSASVARAGDVTCFPQVVPYIERNLYSPQPTEDASVGCVPPLPCNAAAAPTPAEWSPAQTQEVKLTASPGDPLTPTSDYYSVVIWGQVCTGSAWYDRWAVESADSVERAKAAGVGYITYGVAGLLTDAKYRYRVGWCKKNSSGVKTCNCYGDPGFIDANADGTVDARPTTFPTPPFALPPNTALYAEDRFVRPPTDPKRSRTSQALLGDGLGPFGWGDDRGAVWANIGNGARIAADGSGDTFAEIPQTSQFVWGVSSAPEANTHTFAEIEFVPHCTTDRANPPTNTTCTAAQSTVVNYRNDVQTRVVTNGGQSYAYTAQAIFEPDWGPEPITTARTTIRRIQGTSNAALVTFPLVGTGALNPDSGLGCVIDGTNAAATEANTSGLREGGRILLRVRVKDDTGLDPHPRVRSTIAWNWNGTGYDRHCTWEYHDTAIGPGNTLYDQAGGGGFFVHHWDARIERYAAGSGTP